MNNVEAKSLPLAGVKVLDLSRVLAGSLCSMALGDLGAEVLKIEHLGRGDDTRDWGVRIGKTETSYCNCANRNKRSLTLDLQSPEAVEIVHDLVKQCDVVLQNFKFGGAKKMGLGYEQLKALRPDIVYCSITGYDSSGPKAARPGYNLLVQGEAGLMSINGEPDRPPVRFGVPLVDMFTGMYSAQAVLAALYEREKTGKGAHIEMALFDSGLMITGYFGLEALLSKNDPPRFANSHPTIIPYGVYESSDGTVVITVGNNAQFERFCRDVIDRPDLAADARFKGNLDRVQHRDFLLPEILMELCARPSKLLLGRLASSGIPCGEVLGLHGALTSDRAVRNGLVTEQPNPVAGTIPVLAPPYRIDAYRMPIRDAPPTLGQGTDEILQRLLNMRPERLADLRGRGVI